MRYRNMEASSITNTSNGSGYPWSNAACILVGRSFSSRWTVCPSGLSKWRRTASGSSKPLIARCSARAHMCRRFACRCGKRDVGKIFVFTANQRQQFGNCCRFARFWSAGNHHKDCNSAGRRHRAALRCPCLETILRGFASRLPRVGRTCWLPPSVLSRQPNRFPTATSCPKTAFCFLSCKARRMFRPRVRSAASASASPPLQNG